ncbi:MAG TPA: hypothetical protein DIV41_01485 [Ruminococcaceae bacterium]|jgi:hypothetical protein|nr:hypothetical protein [Oscillospiraceae bacterium]
MLGKLLKYEIKSTARVFLPIYGLIIALALLNKFFIANNTYVYSNSTNKAMQIAATVSMMTYVAFIVALFVVTLVVLIRRFYRNLLGDEGYLSFTLPVSIHSHIDSKLIVTFMWEALSLIVAGFSIFIMTINGNTMQSFSKFCMGISEVYEKYGPLAHQLTAEAIIFVILSMLACILQIYASIVIGNLSGKHKMLASFGVFIGFGIVQQIILSNVYGGRFGKNIMDGESFAYFMRTELISMIIFSLVFAAVFYFITDWMLRKKLNIE